MAKVFGELYNKDFSMSTLREHLNDLNVHVHQLHRYLYEIISEENLTQEETQRAINTVFLDIHEKIDQILIDNFPLH